MLKKALSIWVAFGEARNEGGRFPDALIVAHLLKIDTRGIRQIASVRLF